MTLLKNKAVSELCFKRGLAESQLLGGSWAWKVGVLWRGWQRRCCRLALMVIGSGRCLQQLQLMGCHAGQGPDLKTLSAPQRMYGPESMEKSNLFRVLHYYQILPSLLNRQIVGALLLQVGFFCISWFGFWFWVFFPPLFYLFEMAI